MYAIGNDHTAVALKQIIKEHLEARGIEVRDFGTDSTTASNYAAKAEEVANAVASGECERGILICGTGIGMSIAANKVRGAYAALISDVYSAERAEKSNNANIACFGAFTLGEKLMESLLRIWLASEYRDGTPSAPKVERIVSYEMQAAQEQS